MLILIGVLRIKKKYKKHLITSIVAIIVFFVFAFFVSEIYFRIYLHTLFTKQPLPFYSSDIKDVPYIQTNFSLINVTKTKPRILIIGDYISIHKSYANHTSYPELVDMKLNYSFEIINTGAVYYSMPEEINLLRNKGLDYNPDFIVWGFVFNDLDFDNKLNAIIPLEAEKAINELRVITPLAINCIKIYNQFNNISKFYENKTAIVDYYYNHYQDKTIRKYLENNLNELKQLKEEKGVGIIFLIVPIFIDFNDKRLNYINEVVYQECLNANLSCINLLTIFKRYNVTDVKENDHDIWHQNSLGNEIIATEIYKEIIKNKSKNES